MGNGDRGRVAGRGAEGVGEDEGAEDAGVVEGEALMGCRGVDEAEDTGREKTRRWLHLERRRRDRGRGIDEGPRVGTWAGTWAMGRRCGSRGRVSYGARRSNRFVGA